MKYTPLLVFVGLCVLLALGLAQRGKHNDFTSKMIGQKVEPFTLISLGNKENVTIPLGGKVTVLNIFASWCESCQAEHAVLSPFADKIPIIGIAWKDKPEKIENWLTQHGNPYHQVLLDDKGKSTLPLALSGIPETFVIDKHGVIVYNTKMPLTEEELRNVVMPLVEKLHE
jgi:cytochrome c biogenesis protein CcmG/thiol:disulfide interchange protein DsbE